MLTDTLIGKEIGSYRILDIIGRGGMGTVYLATQPNINKRVVFKILKPEHSQNEASLQRFFNEARAVNQIRHENIVDITDCGKTVDGNYYIQMEYLEGKTLQDVIRTEGPLALKRFGHIALQVCSALAAAHDHGIVHRDLKSDNIFLTEHAGKKDFAKLLDFGIAKLETEKEEVEHPTTVEGAVLGTPLYMSPEQALGKAVDLQSDIYSMGVMLFQMATGAYPFTSKSPFAVATMHVWATPPRPSQLRADISPLLEQIILRCLEKEKAARFSNVYGLAVELGLACGIDPAPYFFREGLERLQEEAAKQIDQSCHSMAIIHIPDEVTPRRERNQTRNRLTVALLLSVTVALWYSFAQPFAENASAAPMVHSVPIEVTASAPPTAMIMTPAPAPTVAPAAAVTSVPKQNSKKLPAPKEKTEATSIAPTSVFTAQPVALEEAAPISVEVAASASEAAPVPAAKPFDTRRETLNPFIKAQ